MIQMTETNREQNETERIYILDSETAIRQAEQFKAKLENKGFKVTTKTYGINGVRISGEVTQ